MLKIRLMGTAKDIRWFEQLLRKNPKVSVTEMSELFSNKGTKHFFFFFMEIEKASAEESQQNAKENVSCVK